MTIWWEVHEGRKNQSLSTHPTSPQNCLTFLTAVRKVRQVAFRFWAYVLGLFLEMESACASVYVY